MTTYAYDVEVLKNLFTATFVNVQDETEQHVFYVGLDKLDWTDLSSFLRQRITLVGYNNISYDDPVLRYVLSYKGDNLLTDLVNVSNKLVDDNYRGDKALIELRYPRKTVYPWNSVDLMKLLAFDKLGISLKQVAINLKWHKIMDMPISHLVTIIQEQLSTVLEYNLNDVLITKELYHRVTPLRELRRELSKLYNVDLSSASDSRMANLILEHIYSDELKMDIRQIREKRTPRDFVFLKDCVAPFVKFETPYMNEVLERLMSKKVENYNGFKYGDTIYFANCKFTLGIGGLHSEDKPGVFESDDKYIIQDMDVASYYPNLIINNNFYPEHLGQDFIKVLKRITDERLKAKASGDKVKADGLKITINSIFGKLGLEHFWLLDPKQLLSTTVSGQLGLLMLIEDLHEKGINVISANTDGIVCKIPRELEKEYYEIAKRWEEQTNLQLEFTPYKKYVRRDVNTYLTEKKDGSIKQKGIFLTEVSLMKAYRMPIVAKALNNYFVKNIPVKQTLEECTDIMEFCLSQKSGEGFKMELHTVNGVVPLQKTNRYFISKKGGALIKRNRYSGKISSMHVGENSTVLNDFDPSVPFSKYEVNYVFYEKEVMKIIDEIEPKQTTLFDISEVKGSSLKKMEFNPYFKEQEFKNSKVDELNKLGKNQLLKKIESIVNNNEVIENISPRYIYVLDFNTKMMKAEVYCLGKGIKQVIDVDKKAYKNTRLEKGLLVFCDKFKKLERGHSLTEYHITEKIEEQKETLL